MIRLSEMLVMHMLDIDDEPLYLIMGEANINENTKEYLKPEFRRNNIQREETKEALVNLYKNKMIIVLNEHGDILDISNISNLIEDSDPQGLWFRITQHGRQIFEEYYPDYWLQSESD